MYCLYLIFQHRTAVKYILCFGLLTWTGQVSARIIPNSLFSDHMVLQQGLSVRVWGYADEGEKVTVKIKEQTVTTITRNGQWQVQLLPMAADPNPSVMTIFGRDTIHLSDILIGEVWVCSGQSNMGRKMGSKPNQNPIFNYESEKKAAVYPMIRQYQVSCALSDSLVCDGNGELLVCSPGTIDDFSAVGYFFARDLQHVIKIPVGLIHSLVGGTEAKHWVSRQGLLGHPSLAGMVTDFDCALKNFPDSLKKYYASLPERYARYQADSIYARMEKRPLPKKLSPPNDPSGRRRISCFFNGMIAPIVHFPVKGILWYQGESDTDFARRYQTLFPALIDDWRNQWGLGEIPFIYVQIAPCRKIEPEIREAQLLTLVRTRNTAMVVTTDCGEANNIHPAWKQPVGFRLSLAARALAYGDSIEYMGPVYESFEIRGKKIVLSFRHVPNGLATKEGDLKGFAISGADKKFVKAYAFIEGNNVVVRSDSVQEPIAVRYGWASVPEVNLYNAEGLPASPFRTDVE